MADRLYLSLWFPNFRLENLPAALAGVLRQFSMVGSRRVSAASAYPINFSEAPTYQRIFVNTDADNPAGPGAASDPTADTSDAAIDKAVAEATEQLHDDMAYEFEMRWQLWAPEDPAPSSNRIGPHADADQDPDFDDAIMIDPEALWKLRPHTVRVLGFGPEFDVAGYEQNGHILIDFGLDTPWVMDELEDEEIDDEAQLHIQQNIEKLLAFTLLVEKHCGISSRLLWTESGEPLAEKLIARLQRVN